MAIDSNAVTLSEYAVMSNSPLVQKITYSLIEKHNVLQDIPLVGYKSMLANGVRWVGNNLPTVNWAKLNEEPAVTKGKPTPYQEQAYLVRNAIDVDVKITEDVNNITDPRGAQMEAFLRALTYDVNNKFINNNHTTGDSDAPLGLRWRLDNPTDSGCESEMKINGGGVVMTQALAAADANTFLELLEQLLDFMDAPDGEQVVIYVNDTLKRRFNRAMRVLGGGAGFNLVVDAFGRTVDRYKNAVIRDIGRTGDQSTRVITATETAAGVDGAGAYTSLYAVKYGQGSFYGWQFEDLEQSIRDLGVLNNGVTARMIIDWAVGLMQEHTRAVGRIYNIKVS